uniref:DDE_Tnp_1_7 domain-containing protein n=1 Tax=Haemonchus contortus TaxID=6289 RepID=A0A7I4XYV8_HAECO
MTGELVKLVNEESNSYGSAKYSTWSVLAEQQFYKLSAICFHMNTEKRSSLKEYWSTRIICSGSFAARLMTGNHFIEILNSLHFVDNDASDKSNRLYKAQPVIDLMNKACGDEFPGVRKKCYNKTC